MTSNVKPARAAKALAAAGLLCGLIQSPPAEAQVQQLMGLATKAVPMLIMQGVKEYKKATDPAYAKAEKERPKGKDADDAFLDGDNFSGEWKELGKQNSHIHLKEAAVEGDVDGAAQAIKDKAARKKAREATNGPEDYSDVDVKRVSVQASKPAMVVPERDREGSDWFMDDVPKSKPKPAEEIDANATIPHSESVQAKIIKSPAVDTTSTTAKSKSAGAEKPAESAPAAEGAPVIMMPIAK